MPQYAIQLMPQDKSSFMDLQIDTTVEELCQYLKEEYNIQTNISEWTCYDQKTNKKLQLYEIIATITPNIDHLLIYTDGSQGKQKQKIDTINLNYTATLNQLAINQTKSQNMLNETFNRNQLPYCKIHQEEKVNYIQLNGNASFLCDDCICDKQINEYMPLKKFVKMYNDFANQYDFQFQDDLIESLKKLVKELVSTIENKLLHMIQSFRFLKQNIFQVVKGVVGQNQIFSFPQEQINTIRNIILSQNQVETNNILLIHQVNKKTLQEALNKFQEVCVNTKEQFEIFGFNKIHMNQMDQSDFKIQNGKLFYKNKDLMIHNASVINYPIFEYASLLQNKLGTIEIQNEVKLRILMKESKQSSNLIELNVNISQTIESMLKIISSQQKRIKNFKKVEITDIQFQYEKDKLKTIKALNISEANLIIIKWE